MSTPIESQYARQILEKLQYQGSRNDCAPYTIATVVNALKGESLAGDQLGQEMNIIRWRGPLPIIRRIRNWATFPWGMVDVFRDHGLAAQWWLFVPREYLRPALANGHILMPVIADWRERWAHVMTLIAWDEAKGWGFANTQRNNNQIDWFAAERFYKLWQAAGRLLVEIAQP
jgi:hypothetical protein